jgi:YggT family protein
MIRFAIWIYVIILITDTVLSYVPQSKNWPWTSKIKKLADFSCQPVRKYLPPNQPVDFSPLVVIVFLQLLILFW